MSKTIESVTVEIGNYVTLHGGREKEIIVRRFGLLNHTGMTLAEIAELQGVVPERVRHIEMLALRKIRGMMWRSEDELKEKNYLQPTTERDAVLLHCTKCARPTEHSFVGEAVVISGNIDGFFVCKRCGLERQYGRRSEHE